MEGLHSSSLERENIRPHDFFVIQNLSHKEISLHDLEGKVKKCTRKYNYKIVTLVIKPTAASTFSILSFLHKLPKRVRGGVGFLKKPCILGLIIICYCQKMVLKI